MKLIYKPFGIVLGIVAGILGKKLFEFVWARFDDEEPPKATTRDVDLPKVIVAAALEGLIFKTVRAGVDRAGARGFEHLTGAWPGEKQPDPAGIG